MAFNRRVRVLVSGIMLVWLSVAPIGLQAGNRALTAILEPVLADLSRVGVLGSTLAISIPGHEPVMMASGYVSEARENSVATSSLFQIGSQTKMFTAAAILLLERDGKLSLNDPVAKFVKGVTGSPDVTIAQLLTHTSGIGDSIVLFDPPAERPDYHVSFEDHLLLGKVSGQQFEAGEGWQYNNLGFVVLGRIVELASGEPLDRFIRARLLNPLGMNSTWLGALEPYPEARMARGYYVEQKTGELNDSTMPNLSWASSAGDMVSSLDDMLKWFKALQDSKNPTGLSMRDFNHAAVSTGSPGNMQRYGYGMMGRILNGSELWGHGGNIHGYVTLTMMDADSGIIVALMTSLVDHPDNQLPVLESVVSMVFHMSLLQAQGR
jgi:CubicO group peptidase (beta-lactamase class C family)